MMQFNCTFCENVANNRVRLLPLSNIKKDTPTLLGIGVLFYLSFRKANLICINSSGIYAHTV